MKNLNLRNELKLVKDKYDQMMPVSTFFFQTVKVNLCVSLLLFLFYKIFKLNFFSV